MVAVVRHLALWLQPYNVEWEKASPCREKNNQNHMYQSQNQTTVLTSAKINLSAVLLKSVIILISEKLYKKKVKITHDFGHRI